MRLILDFSIASGGFRVELHERLDVQTLALFGPSGAGKTTVLEVIAGLRRPDAGEIVLDDRVLLSSARAIDLPARARGLGYVPQDSLLFPHLNVRRNIMYGTDGRRTPVGLERVLEMLEIAPLIDRRIDGLSGGERQRVALARALMAAPSLLLLDEPLAAVDVALRRRIVPYLMRIRDELRIPMVYVTHDAEEARMLADQVLMMANGCRVGSGPPEILHGGEQASARRRD
jgi:molybdate transport system ATP-binding protein